MEDAQPTAQSPDVSPVQLRDCIEELLRAVLEWSIDGTLGVHIGISPEFCSTLLDHGERDDRASAVQPSSSTDIAQGVPLYPLYKSLATALHQSIASGSFFSRYNEAALISEDNSSKQIKEEWEDLISCKGSELLTEPFFSQLKGGSKTVEGSCAVGDYNRICSGDLIMFNKCLVMEVFDVHHYITFAKMLETEGLSKVLPGVTTIQDDSVKNELGMEATRTIIVNCRWMNVHIVKPHEAVFEIRVPEGYGARWARDGRQADLTNLTQE